MSNTIDADLYPHLYSRIYQVARKQTGFIGAVNSNFAPDPVDVNSMGKSKTFVKVPVAGAGSASDFTPAQVATVGGDTTDTEISVQITKSRKVAWHQTVSERKSLDVGGSGNSRTLWLQKFENAAETLMDEVEGEIAGDIYKEASRARGVAGTVPFASDLSPLSAVKRELDDNGCPVADRSFVMSPAASENFMNLNIVQAANAAGSTDFLRNGVLLNHLDFDMRISRSISAVTKGTATGFDSNGGDAVGATTLTMDGSDAGTILAGDVVTFVGDTNKYVVANTSQSLSGNATGDIVINKPGLKETLVTTVEGTLGANFTPNIAVQRDGYVLATRPPMIEANSTVKSVTQVMDAKSGLTFSLVELEGYGLITWEVHLAWGKKGIQPNFIINYLG